MLTQRGWVAAGVGVALLVLWYIVGEVELGIAGLLILAAVVASLLAVRGRRPRLGVLRRSTPPGVHEGDHASVNLRIVNRGPLLRQLTITDEVIGLGTAEFATAEMRRGETVTAAYRVLCRPRGAYPIGPVSVEVADPLGLAATATTAGTVDTLVVYPSIEVLDGLPGVPGRNLAVNAVRPEHSQRGGEDFYTLREYQQGDDMRRVHWPSSARRDRLMIRQLETPWQARALILLDVRARAYPDEGAFEAAVTGAASALRHLGRGGFTVDLWTGDGEMGPSGRRDSYTAALERMAVVTTRQMVDLPTVASGLRQGGGGMLVLVTGRADETLLGVARMLGPTHPSRVLMSSAADDTTLAGYHQAGITVVAPAPGATWAESWSRAIRGAAWQAASVSS